MHHLIQVSSAVIATFTTLVSSQVDSNGLYRNIDGSIDPTVFCETDAAFGAHYFFRELDPLGDGNITYEAEMYAKILDDRVNIEVQFPTQWWLAIHPSNPFCVACYSMFSDSLPLTNLTDQCGMFCLGNQQDFVLIGRTDRTADAIDSWRLWDWNLSFAELTSESESWALPWEPHNPPIGESGMDEVSFSVQQKDFSLWYDPRMGVVISNAFTRWIRSEFTRSNEFRSLSDWSDVYNALLAGQTTEACFTVATGRTHVYNVEENADWWTVLCQPAMEICPEIPTLAPTQSPTFITETPINIEPGICDAQNLDLVFWLDYSKSVESEVIFLKNWISDIINASYSAIQEANVENQKRNSTNATLRASVYVFGRGNYTLFNFGEYGVIQREDLASIHQDLIDAPPVSIGREGLGGTFTKTSVIHGLEETIYTRPPEEFSDDGLLMLMVTDGNPDDTEDGNTESPCDGNPIAMSNLLAESKGDFYLVTAASALEFSQAISSFNCLFGSKSLNESIIRVGGYDELNKVENVVLNLVRQYVCDVENSGCDLPFYPTDNSSSMDPSNRNDQTPAELDVAVPIPFLEQYLWCYEFMLEPSLESLESRLNSYNRSGDVLDRYVGYAGFAWINTVSVYVENLRFCNASISVAVVSPDTFEVVASGTEEVSTSEGFRRVIFDVAMDPQLTSDLSSGDFLRSGLEYIMSVQITVDNCLTEIGGQPVPEIRIPTVDLSAQPMTSEVIQDGSVGWDLYSPFANLSTSPRCSGVSDSDVPMIAVCWVFPRLQPTFPPTMRPTAYPSMSPSQAPTVNPTANPTANPTSNPTGNPTHSPTAEPTTPPTGNPTGMPTESPSKNPTQGPTQSPTQNPTEDPTANPTQSPTDDPTAYPTGPPTANPTGSPNVDPTASPTGSPSESPTKNPSESPTMSPTESPTGSPTGLPTGNPTQSPSDSPTENPTQSPSDGPTANPTGNPTNSPTVNPTAFPSDSPTQSPTVNPTGSPTEEPTIDPTQSPTANPTFRPTLNPTVSPTESPTEQPSGNPTQNPTLSPNVNPTLNPTANPTMSPSENPTVSPSQSPSQSPSMQPTQSPSNNPTDSPTLNPTANPTQSPSDSPTSNPSQNPSQQPSMSPSLSPSTDPTQNPTLSPNNDPSPSPTLKPTGSPSVPPTLNPTDDPTSNPTANPSGNPTEYPSMTPSEFPSQSPSDSPSNSPSASPNNEPTQSPTLRPTGSPTTPPTANPTSNPTGSPSQSPSVDPTNQPTLSPNNDPSPSPTVRPSDSPSASPSDFPSLSPSSNPSFSPSMTPTRSPGVTPTSSPTFCPYETPKECLYICDDESGSEWSIEFVSSEFAENTGVTFFQYKVSVSQSLACDFQFLMAPAATRFVELRFADCCECPTVALSEIHAFPPADSNLNVYLAEINEYGFRWAITLQPGQSGYLVFALRGRIPLKSGGEALVIGSDFRCDLFAGIENATDSSRGSTSIVVPDVCNGTFPISDHYPDGGQVCEVDTPSPTKSHYWKQPSKSPTPWWWQRNPPTRSPSAWKWITQSPTEYTPINNAPLSSGVCSAGPDAMDDDDLVCTVECSQMSRTNLNIFTMARRSQIEQYSAIVYYLAARSEYSRTGDRCVSEDNTDEDPESLQRVYIRFDSCCADHGYTVDDIRALNIQFKPEPDEITEEGWIWNVAMDPSESYNEIEVKYEEQMIDFQLGDVWMETPTGMCATKRLFTLDVCALLASSESGTSTESTVSLSFSQPNGGGAQPLSAARVGSSVDSSSDEESESELSWDETQNKLCWLVRRILEIPSEEKITCHAKVKQDSLREWQASDGSSSMRSEMLVDFSLSYGQSAKHLREELEDRLAALIEGDEWSAMVAAVLADYFEGASDVQSSVVSVEYTKHGYRNQGTVTMNGHSDWLPHSLVGSAVLIGGCVMLVSSLMVCLIHRYWSRKMSDDHN